MVLGHQGPRCRAIPDPDPGISWTRTLCKAPGLDKECPGCPAIWVIWGSEMVSANRVAAFNPPIDDTDPIRKFSIDPRSHTDWQNPAEFSSKGGRYGISVSTPHRRYGHRLRTPFLRTPRLLGQHVPGFRCIWQNFMQENFGLTFLFPTLFSPVMGLIQFLMFRKRREPWKIRMLIYLPVTSRPLISLQKEAVNYHLVTSRPPIWQLAF